MKKKSCPKHNHPDHYRVKICFAGEDEDGTKEADTVVTRSGWYVRWLHQIPQDIEYERNR